MYYAYFYFCPFLRRKYFRILTSGTLFKIYLYLYEHYTIYELPWDSSITWFIAALAYDCGYYWFHRAAHGMGFLLITVSY